MLVEQKRNVRSIQCDILTSVSKKINSLRLQLTGSMRNHYCHKKHNISWRESEATSFLARKLYVKKSVEFSSGSGTQIVALYGF